MSNEEYAEIMDKSNFMIDSANPYDMKIKEALEKQIPKKPIIDIGYDMEGNAWNNWRCPCCRENYLLDDEEYDYCPNCGQKIDWSDAEEAHSERVDNEVKYDFESGV